MKRILLSFLLIGLFSCGPSHPLNYVQLEGKPQNYRLVDATDSSITIGSYDKTTAFETIPFRDISHLYIQRNSAPYGWWSGLIGCAAFTAGAIIIDKSGGKQGDGLEAVGGVLYVGIPVAIIVSKAADGMQEVDFNTPEGVRFLKERAGTY
jgi:hypothetical protein